MIVCNNCGEKKDESCFYYDKERRAYRKTCRDCRNKRTRDKRNENIEESRAKERESYAKNHEKRRATARLYEINNKEKIAIQQKTYRESNREQLLSYMKVYNKTYKGHKKAYRNKAIDHYGAKCQRCGYDKCISAIHVHHKNRNREDNDMSNLEVLCMNCHAEEHHGQ